jgi:large conductance mechanosensitive channel
MILVDNDVKLPTGSHFYPRGCIISKTIGGNIMFKGFRDFILRGNVLDLAVAVVIGAAFSNIVNALVKDLITPLVGLIGGNPDFSGYKPTFNHTVFPIGDFVNALLSFLIIAAVIYFLIVLPMNKLISRMKKGEKVDPSTKICSQCLNAVAAGAKRCMYCTTVFDKSH